MTALLSLSVRAALVFKTLKRVWLVNKRVTNINNPWRINNARAHRQTNDFFIKHRILRTLIAILPFHD